MKFLGRPASRTISVCPQKGQGLVCFPGPPDLTRGLSQDQATREQAGSTRLDATCISMVFNRKWHLIAAQLARQVYVELPLLDFNLHQLND